MCKGIVAESMESEWQRTRLEFQTNVAYNKRYKRTHTMQVNPHAWYYLRTYYLVLPIYLPPLGDVSISITPF